MKLNNELEQKVAERTKELSEMNDVLKHTIEDLAKFNYIASHDLQEPLRKIQTFSKLIKEKGLPDEKTEMYFDRILVATERMRSLIESLHAFSATKNENLKVENCNLNEMFAEIEDQISDQISNKKAQIQYSNLHSVRGTKILLHQMLTNLVQNSLKYSKEDVSPIVKITTEEVLLNEKPFIKIVLKDNGIGIDNSYKEKIFDLFQRLHQKNEYSGTGIGLTICKNIVQKHNGFIEADGVPNEGTTFTIHLPK